MRVNLSDIPTNTAILIIVNEADTYVEHRQILLGGF